MRSSIAALDVVNLDLCTPVALNMVWAEPKKEHDRVGISGTVCRFGLHSEPAARALGPSPSATTSQDIASVLLQDNPVHQLCLDAEVLAKRLVVDQLRGSPASQ